MITALMRSIGVTWPRAADRGAILSPHPRVTPRLVVGLLAGLTIGPVIGPVIHWATDRVLPAAYAAEDGAEAALRATINRALETERTGSTIRWSGPSGRAGAITVKRTYYRADGTPCRDYAVTSEPGGGARTVARTVEGTGCRAAAGVWTLSAVLPEAASAPRPSSAPAPPSATAGPAPSSQGAARAAVAAVAPEADRDPASTAPELAEFAPAPADRKPTVIAASLPTASSDR